MPRTKEEQEKKRAKEEGPRLGRGNGLVKSLKCAIIMIKVDFSAPQIQQLLLYYPDVFDTVHSLGT